MKSYRIFMAAVIVALIALTVTVNAMAANEIRIFVDGNELITDVAPRIINGRTMVPVRAVSEAMDCTVIWFEPERRVDIYTPYGGELIMSMYVDNPEVTRFRFDSGTGETLIERTTIESPPVIIDDRTLVPLRFIAETFSFDVGWDDKTNTVSLQYRGDVAEISKTAKISSYGAWQIATAWLDAHPDTHMSISVISDEMFVVDGEEYYRFLLGDTYWLDILVHGDTGELLGRQTEDGEFPGPPVYEPLDDYYNRYWGD